MMHLDTAMTMIDHTTSSSTRTSTARSAPGPSRRDEAGRVQPETQRQPVGNARNRRSGWTVVTILTTDGIVRAAEREQWDDGTNYLAVAPGVVFGYDRNVATNTMLESHGFEVVKVSGVSSDEDVAAPVHDLPH